MPSKFVRPDDWEAGYYQDYETLAEIARRLGPDAAARARRRVKHTLRELIEAERGTAPMPKQQANFHNDGVVSRGIAAQRPGQRSAAQIAAEANRVIDRTIELLRQPTTTTTAPDPGAELDRLAKARAAAEQLSYGEALAKVAAENPDLYAKHSANAADHAGAPQVGPVQAAEPMALVTSTLDQLARERMAAHGESYGQALAKVAAEQPGLWELHSKKVTL